MNPSNRSNPINLAGLLIFCMSCSANAGFITEYWTSTITDTEKVTTVNVGDTFTWNVTFSNTSQIMNDYDDGPDGLANTTDDVYAGSFCTDRYTGTNACVFGIFDGHSLFSDAVFVLYLDWSGEYANPEDNSGSNFAWAYDYADHNDLVREFAADDQFFLWENSLGQNNYARGVWEKYTGSDGPGARNSSISRLYFDSVLDRVVTHEDPPATVPTPGTLLLILLGSLGMVSTQYPRKSVMKPSIALR